VAARGAGELYAHHNKDLIDKKNVQVDRMADRPFAVAVRSRGLIAVER
jgi:hypothetical protein